MTTEITGSNRVAVTPDEGPFTPLGLVLSEGLSFEEWSKIGVTLGTIESGINWWIGDWLNYGERAYGEKYTQATLETGRDRDTLANIASVAGKFDLSRRRDNLSWSHHVEVASLEAAVADALLDEAAHDGWSKSTLREKVQARKKALPAAASNSTPIPADTPNPNGNGAHHTNGNGHPQEPELSFRNDVSAGTDTKTSSAATLDEDPIEDREVYLAGALEDTQTRLLQTQAERDSLRVTDKDAEISKLHDRIAREDRLRRADQAKLVEQERIIKSQRRILDDAAKLLNAPSFGDICGAIRDLLQRVR
jgi:hypothetical protein